METTPPKTDTLSVLQLAMGSLGLLLTVLGMLVLIPLAWMQLAGPGQVSPSRMVSVVVVALLYSLILLPSLILPVYRLRGKALPNLRVREPFRLATLLLILWPGLVAAGWFVADLPGPGNFVLPFLSILAIGIPVWWLVETGRRNLPGGSLQRSWGLLGYGMVPNVVIILATELLVMVLMLVGYAVYASGQPDLMAQLEELAQQARALSENPRQLMQFAQQVLSEPGVAFTVMAIGAVLMPMIEEMLKPLALWFLAGRFRHPAEGFSAGLICGGAFAFVESLNLANGMTEMGWAAVVFARVGAGLLHVVTSGLVGWGLVSAWTQGRYLRQALTFLAAVALHGVWNFFGLLMGFWNILPVEAGAPTIEGLNARNLVGPAVLVGLAGLMLLGLLSLNQRLRRETAAQPTNLESANPAAAPVASADLLVESSPAGPAEIAGEDGTPTASRADDAPENGSSF